MVSSLRDGPQAALRRGRFPRREGPRVARLMYQEHLALRSRWSSGRCVGVDGVGAPRSPTAADTWRRCFGRVEVERFAYQAPASTDLHPMDAHLNLPREMFSHVSPDGGQGSGAGVLRRGRESCATNTGSSCQAASRRACGRAARTSTRSTSSARRRATRETICVIQHDGKGVVMRTRTLARDAQGGEKSVRSWNAPDPGEKSNRKRMAHRDGVLDRLPFPRVAPDIPAHAS